MVNIRYALFAIGRSLFAVRGSRGYPFAGRQAFALAKSELRIAKSY
jgi:hypothetical protein